jgi:PPK2 family polyphosphate:nucleotide phosphotransferase
MNIREQFQVPHKEKVKLSKYDPENTLGLEKGGKVSHLLEKTLHQIDSLQYLLYAQKKFAVLVVLQALDAGGKDGTIRHVMSGVSPQGCRVTSFKVPTPEEASHDFLWRIHKAVPEKGEIGMFNRSHYEDVLVVRVHNLVPKKVWEERYDQINAFEDLLAQSNVKILKFFLHISKDEQKKRFEERVDDPDKRWKISEADFAERKYWDDYVEAYQEALTRCNSKANPWFIIPSNKKWFRNLAVSRIIGETLEDLGMKFPKPTVDIKTLKWK